MRYPIPIAAIAVLAIVLSSLNPTLAGPATYSWSGCHVGGHAGTLQGKVSHTIDTAPPFYTRDVSYSSATAGAYTGCSYQIDQVVLGIEGDLNWAAAKGSVLTFSGGGITQFWGDKLDHYATLRARFGLSRDSWHLYATAGIAFADLKMRFDIFDGGVPNSRYERRASRGLVVGAGLEHAIHPAWLVRFEYLYHHFDDSILFVDATAIARADNPGFHVVRLGIARKFGVQP